MSSPFDGKLDAAIHDFTEEAFLYCCGISDIATQEYARKYASMLLSRAQGLEFAPPRIPQGLFEPNRNLIRSTLDKISHKHFPAANNVR